MSITYIAFSLFFKMGTNEEIGDFFQEKFFSIQILFWTEYLCSLIVDSHIGKYTWVVTLLMYAELSQIRRQGQGFRVCQVLLLDPLDVYPLRPCRSRSDPLQGA